MNNEFYKIGVQLALRKLAKADSVLERGLVGTGTAVGVLGGRYLFERAVPDWGLALERRLTSPAQYEELVRKLPEVMDMPGHVSVKQHPFAKGLAGYYYNPLTATISHGGGNMPAPSALAHEIGHTVGLGRRLPWWIALSRARTVGLTSVFPSIIAQAYVDPHSTASKVMQYGPGALMLPTLAEEARASAKALKGLYRAGGRGAMLRGLLPLVPAFATYGLFAAAPIIGGKIVRQFTGK